MSSDLVTVSVLDIPPSSACIAKIRMMEINIGSRLKTLDWVESETSMRTLFGYAWRARGITVSLIAPVEQGPFCGIAQDKSERIL
jgi:hypothetical protein